MRRIHHRDRTGHTSTQGAPRRRRAFLVAPLLAAGLVVGSAGVGASNAQHGLDRRGVSAQRDGDHRRHPMGAAVELEPAAGRRPGDGCPRPALRDAVPVRPVDHRAHPVPRRDRRVDRREHLRAHAPRRTHVAGRHAVDVRRRRVHGRARPRASSQVQQRLDLARERRSGRRAHGAVHVLRSAQGRVGQLPPGQPDRAPAPLGGRSRPRSSAPTPTTRTRSAPGRTSTTATPTRGWSGSATTTGGASRRSGWR